jgi:hypothetical protein
MEQYPCAAMNYPTCPEVTKADGDEICRWQRFLQGLETAMQDRATHLIFKKFNTLGGYIAETIQKIGESLSSPAPEATRPRALSLKGKCYATRPTPKRCRVF